MERRLGRAIALSVSILDDRLTVASSVATVPAVAPDTRVL